MILVDVERKEFNLDEITRGTLIWAKHRTWAEGQAGMVTEVSSDLIRVQYLPSIQNVLNHYFVSATEAASGEWEMRYSPDGLESVYLYPEPSVGGDAS